MSVQFDIFMKSLPNGGKFTAKKEDFPKVYVNFARLNYMKAGYNVYGN